MIKMHTVHCMNRKTVNNVFFISGPLVSTPDDFNILQKATFKNTMIILFVCTPKFCKSIVLFSLGTTVSPKRNWKQFLGKILEGKQRVVWYF